MRAMRRKTEAVLGLSVILGVIALILAVILVSPFVLWLIWSNVIMAVWVTAPAISFWQMFWIWVGLYVAGAAMKTSVTINKD